MAHTASSSDNNKVTNEKSSAVSSPQVAPSSLNISKTAMGENTSSPEAACGPECKTLLISTKRPCRFLERSARELLAGGTEVIILSALGDAIPLCVQLLTALEDKKAATSTKLETTYNPYNLNYRSVGYTPGLRVYMKKHPEFKGSRISPGYVSFSDVPNAENDETHTPCYGAEAKEGFASVNAGDHQLYVGGKGINKAFADILKSAGQQIEKYECLHENLLTRALQENKDNRDSEIRSILMDDPTDSHPDIRIALCRTSPDLRKIDPSGRTGSVYISAFKDKFPHHSPSNMAMVYVVGPKGSEFNSKEEFLDAVHATAVNLMTALCDFNGFVRREEQKTYAKISVCRVCLFSGGVYRHNEATKADVAEAILSGLNEAYRHGPAPRLNFTHDEDVFRKVWTETTGLQIFQNSVNSSSSSTSPSGGGGGGNTQRRGGRENAQSNGF